MKKLIVILCAIFITTLVINTSCKKEKLSQNVQTPPPPPPPPPPSPPPPPPPPSQFWINANVDITIETPIDSALLHGQLSTSGVNFLQYKWQKITGPSSYTIANPDSLITKVSNLVLGEYQFELKVTDTAGNTKRDTMTLKVEPATSSNNQVYFWDLTWNCFWGCSIFLDDLYSYVPANTSFTLYIKRDASSSWELIAPDGPGVTNKYRYDEMFPLIEVWEEPYVTVYDTPAIKIVF